MHTRMLLAIAVVLLVSRSRLSGAEPVAPPAGQQVGTVYGKPITADDIELTGPIDITVRFDARDMALWELKGRISKAFGKPIADRFKEEHKVEATPEEIAAFNENMRASNARRLRETEEKLTDIKGELTTPDLSEDERAKLVERQNTLEKSLASRKESASAGASDEMAKHFIVNWKTERELLRKYGGRVIFQQFGPEALDGRRRLYEEAEKNGDLKFNDPGVRHMFYYYSVQMKHTAIGNDALEKPWFFREQKGGEK